MNYVAELDQLTDGRSHPSIQFHPNPWRLEFSKKSTRKDLLRQVDLRLHIQAEWEASDHVSTKRRKARNRTWEM